MGLGLGSFGFGGFWDGLVGLCSQVFTKGIVTPWPGDMESPGGGKLPDRAALSSWSSQVPEFAHDEDAVH